MPDPIIALSRLDAKALHNRLLVEIPNPALREETKRAVREYKKHRKIERLKQHHHKKLWGDILRDLKYELTNTRVGARYHSRNPNPARDEAFAAYIKVMEKLLVLIEDSYAMTEHTPTHLAKEKNVPNNGEHWTDWVPESVKIRTTRLFDGIPYVPKTKRKLPFQRTSRPVTQRLSKDGKPKPRKPTKREQLLATVTLTFENLAREARVNMTDKIKTKQEQLMRAQAWLEQATDSDAMPRTWHGVLKLL